MTERYSKVADISAIREDGCKVVYFQQKEVALFRNNGEVFAVDNLCPHRKAPLSAGSVSQGVLSCPWHGARFELSSGKGLPGPHQADIASYDVRVVDGAIELARKS